MRIALTGRTMTYLSGQPLYVFETANELSRRGHDVTVISSWADNELKGKLKARVVDKQDTLPELFDVALYSEHTFGVQARKRINIVHSEYDVETPINNCDGYICIRPSIQSHIIESHAIPKEKTTVIYNGVDRERFKNRGIGKGMIAPCTIDPLREKFLNKLIGMASKDNPLTIMGDYYGARLQESEWVTIKPSTFHIEQELPKHKEVHGILLGRVNLEAYSCGLDSYIWNPTTLEVKKYQPSNFDENHNIQNVVEKILIYINTL